ncbi:MAG: M16 family metallopeptidase [Gammaproteobacteria bacterium]
MRIPRQLPAILAAILLALPAAAGAVTAETRLANGLHVIVQEDRRAPVVTLQVWYRVGAAHEPPGRTGISHVLEHMMFKGTRDVPAGEFSRLVSRFGGDHNAFTSVHYTGYYQNYDKSRLPLAMALEADRMRQLVLDEAEFRKELDVVIEERRLRVEDNPGALARERFRVVALPGNPSGQPVIGWPEDLAALTLADLREWYDTWYAPNNAILVVVGDVETADVLRLAKSHFGNLRARRLPRTTIPRSAAMPGLREMTIRVPVAVPSLLMAWNVPSLMTAGNGQNDAWALAVLAGILDGGLSARLETELVRKRKMAATIGAGYNSLERGDTLFTISGTPSGNHSPDVLRKAIHDVIDELRKAGPTAEELARVKKQVVADIVYQQDSLQGQANLIGALAATGHDWRIKDQWSENIQRVSGTDIQRVVRGYLVDGQLAVARIIPSAERRPAEAGTP